MHDSDKKVGRACGAVTPAGSKGISTAGTLSAIPTYPATPGGQGMSAELLHPHARIEIYGLPTSSGPGGHSSAGNRPAASNRPASSGAGQGRILPQDAPLSDEEIRQIFGPLKTGRSQKTRSLRPSTATRFSPSTVRKLRQSLREERAPAGYVPGKPLPEGRYSLGELLLGVRIDGTRIQASPQPRRKRSCAESFQQPQEIKP